MVLPSKKRTWLLCFYVKPNKRDQKTVVKYIWRTPGRHMIATSRIDQYDGGNVTFHYNRHEYDVYMEETIPAMEFIERLIHHMPEKHFKTIRYGSFYARRHKSDIKTKPCHFKGETCLYPQFQ